MHETTLHVRRALAGDATELAWVIERFTPFVEAQIRIRLNGNGRTHDVEDLVSQVWITMLRRLADIVPRDRHYTPVFSKFLGTTALLEANNFLRRLASEPAPLERDPSQPHASVLARETRGIVTSLAEREIYLRVRRCLDGMSADKRDVLVLRLLEHKDNKEIARVLGLKPNTVAARYRRALEELRRCVPDVYREVREVTSSD